MNDAVHGGAPAPSLTRLNKLPAKARAVIYHACRGVAARAGTIIHNWVNRGTAPCVLAVVLVDAKSVEAGGKVLPAVG